MAFKIKNGNVKVATSRTCRKKQLVEVRTEKWLENANPQRPNDPIGSAPAKAEKRCKTITKKRDKMTEYSVL